MASVKETRTAVLVVHGMGIQRPLDTVRGVVDAVWLNGGPSVSGPPRIWTHPAQTGVDDIDLPVITTNFLTKNRRIDFHELYWSHLMSETRAVAVLLWLFELAKIGPRLKPSISAVYWGALIFLSALVLSLSLLVVDIIVQFAVLVGNVSDYKLFGPSVPGDIHSLSYVLSGTIAVIGIFALLAALLSRSYRLFTVFLVIVAISVGAFALIHHDEPMAELLTRVLFPFVLAAIIVQLMMGTWGLAGLAIVGLLSYGLGAIAFCVLGLKLEPALMPRIPWAIPSFWSAIGACYVIGLYLALSVSFLQPYLGDAARYFRNSPSNVAVRREIRRQAVNTLQALHLSGNYDRIVVVAHSLGTVVAYDMLRAYYGRINNFLPDPSTLGADFIGLDQGSVDMPSARAGGRRVIELMAQEVAEARKRVDDNKARPGDDKLKAWLVTDFVTLGSPLTHAHYLMCRGKAEDQLKKDFDRRVQEREFPTCPPRKMDGDGRLTFDNPGSGKREFHHGGLFALTRWTNLFFLHRSSCGETLLEERWGRFSGTRLCLTLLMCQSMQMKTGMTRASRTYAIGISRAARQRHIL